MKNQQPIASEEEHRVLKFRPRTTVRPPGRQGPALKQDVDHEPNDALTAVGIWLAMSIADMRKTQDCVLMGRRDCARISTPHF